MKTINIPFFFIVGKGRSGTTLLQNFLDANPNLQVPPESTFIIHLYSKYYQKNWNKKVIYEFINDLYSFKLFVRDWNLNRNTLTTTFLEHYKTAQSFNYAIAVKIVYLCYLSPYPKTSVTVLGDKNPFYTFYIKTLLKIFPEAKFIHLTRDPRANIRSHILAFHNKNIGFIAYKWLIYNAEIERFKNILPERFFTLSHEALITNPSKELKAISDFLEVKFYEDSLEFKKLAKKGTWNKRNFTDGIHRRLIQPLSSEVNEQWRDFFSSKDLFFIEQITQSLAREYNYFSRNKIITSKISFRKIKTKFHFYAWLYFVFTFYKLPFSLKKIAFKFMRYYG